MRSQTHFSFLRLAAACAFSLHLFLSPASAQASEVTDSDIARMLDLGVPADAIADVVRNKPTKFTDIKALFAKIRGLEVPSEPEKTVALRKLAQEITESVYYEGKPLSERATTATSLVPSASTPPHSVASASPPTFEVKPGSLAFGSAETGSTSELTFSLTNKGRGATQLSPPLLCDSSGACSLLTNDLAVTPGSSPCPSSLASAESCNFKVAFTPTRADVYAYHVLVKVTDATGAVHPISIPAYGKGLARSVSLDAQPGILRFEQTEVSSTRELVLTITNNSSAAVKLGQPRICDTPACAAVNANYSMTPGDTPCSSSLARTGRCSYKVAFTPAAAGTFAIEIRIDVEDAGGGTHKLVIPAQATAIPRLVSVLAQPDRLYFDDTEANSTSARSFAITNEGEAPVTLGPPRICDKNGENCSTLSDNFTIAPTNEQCSSSLAKAKHCDFKVTFAPASAITFEKQILFDAGDAKGGKRVIKIPVFGKGIVPGMASVVARDTGQNHPSSRSIAGFDISGATSTDTQQKAFVEFALNVPIGLRGYVGCRQREKKDSQFTGKLTNKLTGLTKEECDGQADKKWVEERRDPLNRHWWFFFNPRITSVRQEASPLSNLNLQGITDLFSSQTSKTSLVQGIDILGGVEYLIVKPRSGIRFFSSYKHTEARIGLAAIVGAGFATPFAGVSESPTVFTLAADSPLRERFGTPDPNCVPSATVTCPPMIDPMFTNIAFVNQERSRFFRKYYIGFRLKTYHFSPLLQDRDQCDSDYRGPCYAVHNAYPGVIDLTVGQDEQITGGHLSRWLFRLDAVYPLPFASGMHIFGSIHAVFKKNSLSDPVFLPATSQTPLSDPTVFPYRVEPRDRDVYRLGLGVDLLQVVKKLKEPAAGQSSPSPDTVEKKKEKEEAAAATNKGNQSGAPNPPPNPDSPKP